MSLKLNDNLAIIIPAYNETGKIGSTIEDIRRFSHEDIIVVSDGSTDNTANKARASGAVVIEIPFNLGYGSALQTGFKYALEKGYKFAVQMDADGQHDPSSLPALINPVIRGEVDVAIGSRFLGDNTYRSPVIRRIGMFFFASIARLVTRKKITDPTSGYQAINRKAMELFASEVYPADYPDADVIIMLYRKGIRFTEVPVKMNMAIGNTSMHSGLRPLYYIFKMLLSIFVTLLRSRGEGQV